MTDQTNTNPICRTFCWLIAIALGGFLAVTLVNDFGQDQLQSGVIGVVTILLSGLLLRRVLCRRRGNRVARRVAEAAARASDATAEKPATTGKDKRPAAAAIKSELSEKAEAKPQPDASDVDAKLKARVLGEAQKVARADGPEKKAPAPLTLSEPVGAKKPKPAPETIPPRAPKGLERPNDGQPDDLQKIDGIGSDEETALHAAGIFHFQQLVTMNRRELAWLDQNIAANDGSAQSGNWRKQAIALSRKAG